MEAMKTSEIEGEILDRESVQSSVRRHFGLATENKRIRPAERGIAEMMVDLYHSFDQPTLVAKGALIRTGVRRHTRYRLNSAAGPSP